MSNGPKRFDLNLATSERRFRRESTKMSIRVLERYGAMRIWNEVVTDYRGVLTWSVRKQGNV
jgi:hypothetical protein